MATVCGKNLCWIGATDEEEEGKWLNVDGSPLILEKMNFENTGGKEHWLTFGGGHGTFNDWGIGGRIPYVCEWSK